jgi:hypothetical protein
MTRSSRFASLLTLRRIGAAPLLLALFALAAASSSGCGSQRFLSVPSIPAAQASKRPVSIAILDLEDARATKDYVNSSLGAIPIVVLWYGYRQSVWDRSHLDRLPGKAGFPKAIPDAVARELRETGAFSEVVRVSTLEDARQHTFIAKGKLMEGALTGKYWTYGFSVLRWLPWAVALPKQSDQWSLSVEYQLVDGLEQAPVAPAQKFEVRSSSRTQSKYGDRYDVSNFVAAAQNLGEAVAAHLASKAPAAGSPQLAQLAERHERFAREQRIRIEAANRIEPPVIAIASPRSNQEFRQNSVTMDWRVDAAGRIKSARLSRNGKPLELPILAGQLRPDRQSSPGAYSESTPIPLEMGENALVLEVTDFLDQTSRQQVRVTRFPRRMDVEGGKRLALVIGVSEYSGPLAGSGAPGEQNARAMAQYLSDPFGGQMAPSNVELIVGAQAPRDRVMEAIERTSRDAIAGYQVIVYFSGLSVALDPRRGPAYFMVSGSTPDNLGATAVDVSAVNRALGESLADSTLFIVDAAYPAEGFNAHAQGYLTQTSRRLGNLAVWVSTDRGSATFPTSGATFTEMLLRGLVPASDLDHDGAVSLEEAVEAVRSAASDGNLPPPRIEGRYKGELPLKMLE